MRGLYAVSALVALSFAATPAFADQIAVPPDPPQPPDPLIIATDPAPIQEPEVVVEPPPLEQEDAYMVQPYSDPVAPPEEYDPHESTFVYGAATQLNISGKTGIDPAGWGGTVGFGHVERHGDQPTGVDIAGTFMTGKDVSIYDLSLRVIASPKMGTHVLVPYVALGICAGASRIITDRDRMAGKHVDYGLGIGPSASVGVHGFVGKSLYWRAGAGFLGAGVGAVTADLAVGMVVD